MVFSFVALVAINQLETGLVSLGEFHSNALHQIQTIDGGTKEAIEEAFAYIVSGEEIEKIEFMNWSKTFETQAQRFESLANIQGPGEETEKAIFSKIKVTQQRLLETAITLFQEFEKRGTISIASFHVFEEIVDELTTNLHLLVQIELQEVREAQKRAIDLIEDAEFGFYTLGILSVLLALGLGWYFSREISQPIGQLGKVAQQIGEGQFAQRANLTPSNEFGILASKINLMAENLEKSHTELVSKNMELQLQRAHLMKSELRFRLVARTTFDAIWDWDFAKNSLEWNDGTQSVFGYEPDAVGQISPGGLKMFIPKIRRGSPTKFTLSSKVVRHHGPVNTSSVVMMGPMP